MAKAKDGIEYLIEAKVNKAIANLKKFDKTTEKSQKKNESLLSKIKKGYLAIGAAIAGVTLFIAKSVKAFATQEKAEKLLNKAFSQTSKNADALTEKFKKFAAEQQKVTKFGDEVTIMAAAQLQALAGLTGEGLEKALKATMDLSVAQGIDLNTAALLVGKSVSSSTNALARYGIEMKKGGTATERLNDLTGTLSRKFGGFAEAEGKTASGIMAQFSNNVGDLFEVIGGKLMPVIGFLATKFNELVQPQKTSETITNDLVEANKKYKEALDAVEKSLDDNTTAQGSNNEARLASAELNLIEVIKAQNAEFTRLTKKENQLTEAKERRQKLGIKSLETQKENIKLLLREVRLIEDGDKINIFGKELEKREAQTRLLFLQEDILKRIALTEKFVNSSTGERLKTIDTIALLLSKHGETELLLERTGEELLRLARLRVPSLEKELALKKKIKETDTVDKDKDKDKDKKEIKEGRDVTFFDQAIKDQIAFEKERIDAIKEAAAKEVQIKKETANAIKELAQATFNFLGGLISSAFDRDLANIQKNADAQIAALGANQELQAIAKEEEAERIEKLEDDRDKALDRGDERAAKEAQREIDKINLANQAAAQEKAIKEKSAEEEKKIKKKIAISDKIFSIFSASLDFAKAISSAFAFTPTGPVLKSVAAGIAAGIAGVNLAAVAAVPIPAFAQGGTIETSGPQLFLAGDNPSGRERIEVTPLDEGESSGGGLVVNVFGVQDLDGLRNELMRVEGAEAFSQVL